MSDFISLVSIFIISTVVGCFTIFLFYRFPQIAIAVILSVFVIDALLGYDPLIVNMSSANFYLLDFLSLILLVTAGFRVLRAGPWRLWLYLSIITLLGLLFCSLIRGIESFGLEHSINYARTYIYFISTLAFGISFSYSYNLAKRFFYSWGVVAWILVGIVLTRLILSGAGYSSSSSWMAPSGAEVRVINAAQAYFLFQALLFAWILASQKNYMPLIRILPYILLPIIVLLQHRTVWVILAITFLLVILLNPRLRQRWRAALVLSTVLIGVGGIVFWGSPVLLSLGKSAQNLKTFDWRIASWNALLMPERFQGILDYLIGQPFGTGYNRYLSIFDVATTVSPHDFYVQTFLNVGLFGLAALVILYFRLIKFLEFHKKDLVSGSLSLVLFSQLIFFITYAPNFEQGLLLGLAVAYYRSANLEGFLQ